MNPKRYLLALVMLTFVSACGGGTSAFDPYIPYFTDPMLKITQTADPSFVELLLDEAVAYEPLILQTGTQVHMGYWSGAGNHGSLVRVLDSINAIHCHSTDASPQCAIWDEGATSSNQYPAYVEMLQEHWYERGNADGDTVTIYGTMYQDPYPVTFAQADDIWGQYSERYADMAASMSAATGLPVKSWCFVEGARANRIFYMYELPELRQLEAQGAVTVYFARTQDADWQDPDDWIEGTANAPEPAPSVSADEITLMTAF